MRQWLVTLGFMVLLPAIYLQYIALNAYLKWHTSDPTIFAYLAPGIVLTVLGFKTKSKKASTQQLT